MMTPKTNQRPQTEFDAIDQALLLLAGCEPTPLSEEDRRALEALGPEQIRQQVAEAYASPPLREEPELDRPVADAPARPALKTPPEQEAITCRLGKYVLDVPCRVGFVGSVTAGKSVMMNALLGRSPIPCRPAFAPQKETLAVHVLPEDRGRRLLPRVRLLCNLKHPNLLRVHDVGTDQGVGFVVTDWEDGETLQSRLKGPMPPREAAALVETLARTIGFLHKHGVFHRDIKPANVWLGSQGQPRLGGFARLAFRKDLRESRTVDGGDGASLFQTHDRERKKTEEQLKTNDVTQLSALLYRLLTGQSPVHDTSRLSSLVSAAASDKVKRESDLPSVGQRRAARLPLVPLRNFQPDVPLNLEAICLKYLDDSVALDTAGLWNDLRAFLQDEEHSCPTSSVEHPATATQDCTRGYGHGTWPDERTLPVLFRYEIREQLGSGCSSHVFLARDSHLQRMVALKVFRPSHLDTDLVTRFRSEACAVAALSHPNIVPIYEIGEHQGLPYLSLAYIEGGSLAQKTAGQPHPVRPAAELLIKLAAAVQHAHERGIIHRDLKPANILLTDDGEPMIADFGLAKRLESQGSEASTMEGTVLGTPCYMAPEQAAGRSHEVGPTTDVYALGAILYELLTGKPPFRANSSQETLEQVRSCEPTPPRKLRPEVPGDLETICLKCLRKDPRQRYDHAQALADDLRRYLAGLPISARPVPRWERAIKWASRQPVRLLTTAAVAAALLLALLPTLWNARSSASASLLEQALAQMRLERDALRERAAQLEQERDNALNERDHWRQEHDRLKNASPPPIPAPPAATHPLVAPAEGPEPQEEDVARLPMLLREKPFQRDVEQLHSLVRAADAAHPREGVPEEQQTQIRELLGRLSEAVQAHAAALPVLADDALHYLNGLRDRVGRFQRPAPLPPSRPAATAPTSALPLHLETGPTGLFRRPGVREPQRKSAP